MGKLAADMKLVRVEKNQNGEFKRQETQHFEAERHLAKEIQNEALYTVHLRKKEILRKKKCYIHIYNEF